MKEHKSAFVSLFKESIIYGAFGLISKFLTFFVTPLIVHQLTVSELGFIDLFTPVISILGTVATFSMDRSFARFYFEDDQNIRNQVLSVSFLFQLTFSLLISGIIYFNLDKLYTWYVSDNNPIGYIRYLNFILLIFVFQVPFRFLQIFYIWTGANRKYSLLSFLFILLSSIGIISGVYLFREVLLGYYLFFTFICLCFAIYSFYKIIPFLTYKIDAKIFYKMLRYSFPLAPVAILPALIPAIDRSIINLKLGVDQVAIYGIGYRIAMIVQLPISGITTAINPFVLRNYLQKDAGKLFTFVIKCVTFGISTGILILVVFSPWILDIIANENYIGGIVVVGPVSFYFLVELVKIISSYGIELSKKTYWMPALYFINLIVLFAGMVIFVPRLGILGASLAMLSSSILGLLVFNYVGNKLYPLDISISKSIIVILLGSSLCLLLTQLDIHFSELFLIGLFSVFSFFFLFDRGEQVLMAQKIKVTMSKFRL